MREGSLSIFFSFLVIACGSGEPRFQGGPAAASESEHGGAGHHEEHAAGGHEAPQEEGPQPTRVLEDGARLFGSELAPERATTSLSEITGAPDRFAGQVVRTEGTIERVCQRMGCWMELRAENVPPVRVPMAGHSFFLPRDVAGRPATVEGRVEVQPLTEGAREHLESEGAVATASSLAIEATSVVVR
jgi:hypothetical protein